MSAPSLEKSPKWQHFSISSYRFTVIIHLLFMTLEICHATTPPNVNVVLFYDRREAATNFDLAIDYIQNTPSLGITVGEVYKVTVNGSYSSKLIVFQELTKASVFNKSSEKTPDIFLDFTNSFDSSKAVKMVAKGVPRPTISATYDSEADTETWNKLSANQKNYLIQIVPPSYVLQQQAVHSLASKQNMSTVGILLEKNFEDSRKLLKNIEMRDKAKQDNSTNQCFEETAEISSTMGRNEIKRFVDSNIVNFFIIASLKNISSILAIVSNSSLKNETYFTKEFSWHSISMEPGLPQCSGCKDNVSLIHLKPKFSDVGAARRAFLKSQGNLNPFDLFYFDVTVNAYSAVAKLKKEGFWYGSPKPACKESERSPDEYKLKLYDNFVALEYAADANLQSFQHGAVKKSFSKFQMTIRKLQYGPGQENPSKSVELGTWDAGFGEQGVITTMDNMENEWRQD